MAANVRTAGPADAEAIGVVQGRSWEAAYRGLEPDAWMDGWTDARRAARWAQHLTAPTTSVWAAEDDGGALVGFCAMALPTRDDDGDEDIAEITAFYVDPDRWRAGIGGALMDAALAEVAGRGFEAITLWVFEANERARAFYAAAGFFPDGARHALPGEPPEVRMRRAV